MTEDEAYKVHIQYTFNAFCKVVMLHCGDPISYTNLDSKYWQEHFYSYGRLP